ncbi:uncharacterized protein LOC117920438 [Vitis riparia]|uniref:uncharacterized protein LOC117920438 n=1 Tax=Vitis riparia TaxID=96939 RepID=UPI00155A6D8A|nr:uncharacterized protein LOC117920438 [Vitis riparia]
MEVYIVAHLEIPSRMKSCVLFGKCPNPVNTSSAAAWWWVTFPARETKWGFLSRSRKPEKSSETSSLGNLNDDEDDDEDDIVSSSGGGGNDVVSTNTGFCSLGSLEGSLPIKKGLSNCFTGRSKSFSNLSDVNTVADLQKEENPFNKRRRTLIAYKLLRKNSGFYSWQNPNSMPLLTLEEDPNQENNSSEDKEEDKEQKLH